MSESGMEEVKVGVTWRQIVATALATGVAAVLAIYAVIIAPVAPFPGVSGLYLAAAIYVPLSLWLGGWGCIAGYLSCVILGYFSTPFGIWSWLWSFADLFEGLVPLLAFRIMKADVDIGKDLKRSKELYLLLVILIVNLIVAAIATSINLPAVWITNLIIAIVLIVLMYIRNPSKSWLIYVIFGIFGAALVSALWGIWIPILAGFAPAEGYWIGVLGWFAGDLIVLSAIATPLMVALTGKIKQTSVFVEKWWS